MALDFLINLNSCIVKMADDGDIPKFDEFNDEDLFASAIEVLFQLYCV